jgi:glycosyltransferase involved in cell wall biosynthesis
MGGTWLTACLACGVPVVANPLPAHAELAGHDQAALLTVEPAAPRRGAAGVLRLLEDEALRERLVAGGLGRAAEQHVPTSTRSALGSAWDSAPGVTG